VKIARQREFMANKALASKQDTQHIRRIGHSIPTTAGPP
jgi:hypothetical protein